MALSHLAQRVPTPGFGPGARLLARPSTISQLRLSKAGFSCRRDVSSTAACGRLRFARPAQVANSESFQRAKEPDFRRPASVDTGHSAAPRPALGQAPSSPSPNHRGLRPSHRNAHLRPHHHLPAPASRAFSSSAAMAAIKIDGTAIARGVRERLQAEIAEKKAINPRFQPSLKIIQGALTKPRASQCLLPPD